MKLSELLCEVAEYVVDINRSMWSTHRSKLLMVQANAFVTPPKPRKVHEGVTDKLTAVGQDISNRNVVD